MAKARAAALPVQEQLVIPQRPTAIPTNTPASAAGPGKN